jgi:serine/threonine protein kinase
MSADCNILAGVARRTQSLSYAEDPPIGEKQDPSALPKSDFLRRLVKQRLDETGTQFQKIRGPEELEQKYEVLGTDMSANAVARYRRKWRAAKDVEMQLAATTSAQTTTLLHAGSENSQKKFDDGVLDKPNPGEVEGNSRLILGKEQALRWWERVRGRRGSKGILAPRKNLAEQRLVSKDPDESTTILEEDPGSPTTTSTVTPDASQSRGSPASPLTSTGSCDPPPCSDSDNFINNIDDHPRVCAPIGSLRQQLQQRRQGVLLAAQVGGPHAGRVSVIKFRQKKGTPREDSEGWGFHTRYLHYVGTVNAEVACALPHLSKLQGLYQDASYFYVVMEYVDGRDLWSFCKDVRLHRHPNRLELASVIGRELLLGLQELHLCGLMHRDLKLENVVCNEAAWLGLSSSTSSAIRTGTSTKPRALEVGGDASAASPVQEKNIARSGPPRPATLTVPLVQLIDFDTAHLFSGACDERWVRGTDQYIAPEAYCGRPGPESDMWAVGTALYALVTGSFPFDRALFADDGGDNRVGSAAMSAIARQLQQAAQNRIRWTHKVFRGAHVHFRGSNAQNNPGDDLALDNGASGSGPTTIYGVAPGSSDAEDDYLRETLAVQGALAKDFLQRCFETNANERLTVDQALEHEWIRGAIQY